MGAARKLKVIGGKDPDRGREFNLPEQGVFVLGRALSTDTKFVDQLVSGTHCRIEINGEAVYLTDNNSSNGTFIGRDERSLSKVDANKPIPLSDGSHIRLGSDTLLQYIDESVHNLRTQRADDEMLRQLRIASQATRIEDGRQPMGPGGLVPGGNPHMPAAMQHQPAPPPPSQHPAAQQVGPGSSGRMPAMGQGPQPGQISIPCSHCGQQLVAREQYAGMQVRCPTCRNLVVLPGSQAAMPGHQPAPPPAPPPPPPPTSAPSATFPSLPAGGNLSFPSAQPFSQPGSAPVMGSFPSIGPPGGGSYPGMMPPGSSPTLGSISGIPPSMPPASHPMQPGYPAVPTPPQGPHGGSMGPGFLLPPSVDSFSLPIPEQPRWRMRPIHLLLLTLPLVILVVAVVVVVKMLVN